MYKEVWCTLSLVLYHTTWRALGYNIKANKLTLVQSIELIQV